MVTVSPSSSRRVERRAMIKRGEENNPLQTIYYLLRFFFTNTNYKRKLLRIFESEFFNRSGNFVVYSPTITTGIDFQPAQPQNVYVFIEGEDTTSPASVLQMITRNRRIKEVYVSSIKMKNKPEFTSFEQMCQRLDTLSASKAKLAPEALSQVAALRTVPSTKRPTKTTTATLSFRDSTSRPYGMIT